MGLIDLIKKKVNEKSAEAERKRNELLKWQNIVMPDSPNELIMTEQQLKSISQQQAIDDVRIIKDCLHLVETTLKPDVFFMRLNLLREKSMHLCKLEPYVNISGASPADAVKEVEEKYHEAVQQFLIRYFSDTFDKAEAMKTPKGRIGKYQKFYDSLQEYYNYMNEKNIDYIETKYRAYTRH